MVNIQRSQCPPTQNFYLSSFAGSLIPRQSRKPSISCHLTRGQFKVSAHKNNSYSFNRGVFTASRATLNSPWKPRALEKSHKNCLSYDALRHKSNMLILKLPDLSKTGPEILISKFSRYFSKV